MSVRPATPKRLPMSVRPTPPHRPTTPVPTPEMVGKLYHKRRHHHHRISLTSSTPDPNPSLPSNSEHTRFHIGAEHVPCTGQLAKPPGSSPRSPDARHPISPRSRPPPAFSLRHLNPTSTIAQHRLTSAITRPSSLVYRSQHVSQPRYIDAPDFTLVQDTPQHGPISPILHREHHTLAHLRENRCSTRLCDCHAPPRASLNNSARSHCPKSAERCARTAPIFSD